MIVETVKRLQFLSEYTANQQFQIDMLKSQERCQNKKFDKDKVVTGSFYTRKPIWLTQPVVCFLNEQAQLNYHVLDNFAGAGDLLRTMSEKFGVVPHGYDIFSCKWIRNESLSNVPNPHGALICTNSPYLAKHSAKRKRLWNVVNSYYSHHYDLYEVAITQCMKSASAGVFIVPETFIHSKYPKDNLKLVSVIVGNPFTDTETPVCVACFHDNVKDGYTDAEVCIGDEYVCSMEELSRTKFETYRNQNIKFNEPNGLVALKAVDGTIPNDRIRFEKATRFYYSRSKVKGSSRLLTYIEIDGLINLSSFVKTANELLEKIRRSTRDLILSPFKGNNKNGIRRRRLDYALARYIISETVEQCRC